MGGVRARPARSLSRSAALRRYVFSARSAAVLGSRNVCTSNPLELHQIPPALKPAARDGRISFTNAKSALVQDFVSQLSQVSWQGLRDPLLLDCELPVNKKQQVLLAETTGPYTIESNTRKGK